MANRHFSTNRIQKLHPRRSGSELYYLLRIENCGVDRLSEVEHWSIRNRLESLYEAYDCIGAIDFNREAEKIMNGGAARMFISHEKMAVNSSGLRNVYEEVKIYID